MESKKQEQTQDQNQPHKQLQKLIEGGIPVKKAVFHQGVANGFLDPETNFSQDDPKVGRRVQMWLTPTLLICYQNGLYFATPTANVVYTRF